MTEKTTQQPLGVASDLNAELGILTKTITWKEACDTNTCPVCSSKNISFEDSGCMCHCKPSCWSHPVCNDCGYTAGSSAGNSDKGIWVSFGTHSKDDSYVITHEIKEFDESDA